MDAAPFDVLIRGAGPVGCALALGLRGSGLRVAIAAPAAVAAPPAPLRPIALSYASRLILERLDAWQALRPAEIRTVHVSQQGGFGQTRMDAAEAGVPALGYVVDYASLAAALRARVHDLAVQAPACDSAARCVVHAEGASEDAAEKRYAQDAIVGLVELDAPADATAFERFTPEGPLALLPVHEPGRPKRRHALIWSMRPQRARALLQADPKEFLEALGAATGPAIGRPTEIEARSAQPLALRVRPARTGPRSVYIGNAAQTLHPVAGQGLNLGLRDAWELARILREARDPGDAATLARYSASRRLDAFATIRVTDVLAGAFIGAGPAARAARALALCALDVLPGPRRFFARRMIYGPSALP